MSVCVCVRERGKEVKIRKSRGKEEGKNKAHQFGNKGQSRKKYTCARTHRHTQSLSLSLSHTHTHTHTHSHTHTYTHSHTHTDTRTHPLTHAQAHRGEREHNKSRQQRGGGGAHADRLLLRTADSRDYLPQVQQAAAGKVRRQMRREELGEELGEVRRREETS